MPMPLLLAHNFVAYARGDRKRVHDVVRRVKYIGKKNAYGRGKIVSITTEIVDEDFSIAQNGYAMRYLPNKDGGKLVRPRPPYWNNWEKVKCLNVGERIENED